MKRKFCLMGLLCLYFSAYAQYNQSIHPLKIGDSIPDVAIENILNYTPGHARLSDFRDKLIVLDFWATYCGSCISEFPDEVKLQKRYGNRIQFLLVDTKSSKDTKQKVELFFNSYHPSYRSLPCVVEDTILKKYFPHTNVGYYVWIRNNHVLAITDEQELIAKNIIAFTNGEMLKASVFNDIPYNTAQPVFINGNGGDSPGALYRSIITPYKPGLHSSSSYMSDRDGEVTGCQFVNSSIFDLYVACHSEFSFVPFNRIILKVRHPENLSRDSTSETWKKKDVFIYQASFPPTTRNHALALMRYDLDKYFSLRIGTEFRWTKCVVVRSAKNKRALHRINDKGRKALNNDGFFRDFPVSSIVGNLNSKSTMTFVDETSLGSALRLPFEHSDLTNSELIAELKNNGFKVESARRKLKYLVVSEPPSAN